MGTVPREIIRGMRRMFTAPSVRVGGDVLPVILLDDWTKGPYPACSLWHAGLTSAAVAAQFSYFSVRNLGTLNGIVIVDSLTFIFGVAGDLILGVFSAQAVNLSSVAPVISRNTDLDAAGGGLPVENVLGDMEVGIAQNGVSSGTQRVPVNDVLAHTITGPWILGKSGQLTVRSSTLNASLQCYVQGRYYPVVG